MTAIGGHVEDGWGKVADAFKHNFNEHDDLGAAVSVYAGGSKVVDLWGGIADKRTGTPWNEDTIGIGMSTSKGATATCAHMLVERGELDFDAPVAKYWPEFAANGKQNMPVRWLMSHRAGLPYVDRDLTFEELCSWGPVVEALAAQKPYWESGEQFAYHAVTYGFLVGEVIRRVSGRTVGTYFAEEVVRPLGLDAWIGLPEEFEPRVAHIESQPEPSDPAIAALMEARSGPDSVIGRAVTLGGALPLRPLLVTEDGGLNHRLARAAEIPAGNMVTNARSMARMYASLVGTVDGVRLLSRETIEEAVVPQTDGLSVYGGSPGMEAMAPRFALGYMLKSPLAGFLGSRSFGHTGSGGFLAFGDLDAEIGFSYVINQMVLMGDQRAVGLVAAVRETL